MSTKLSIKRIYYNKNDHVCLDNTGFVDQVRLVINIDGLGFRRSQVWTVMGCWPQYHRLENKISPSV